MQGHRVLPLATQRPAFSAPIKQPPSATSLPPPHELHQIVRLVIAGGCISQLDVLAGGIGGNAFNRKVQGAALQPVRDLDLFLVEMAAGLPVDVMPGADDPANVALPQQPMHRWVLWARMAKVCNKEGRIYT